MSTNLVVGVAEAAEAQFKTAVLKATTTTDSAMTAATGLKASTLEASISPEEAEGAEEACKVQSQVSIQPRTPTKLSTTIRTTASTSSTLCTELAVGTSGSTLRLEFECSSHRAITTSVILASS